MEVREERCEGKIILYVEGRVDTNTSVVLQQKLLSAFQKETCVELDMSQSDYVSSAGLRTILIGQKTAQAKHGQLTVKSLQPQVREVFAMSGFDKVITLS